MQKWVLYLCAIGVAFTFLNSGGNAISLGPGVKAPGIPEQSTIESGEPFHHKGSELVPLANYTLSAKVLSRRNYKRGKGSDICPFDFALGWGRMSDETVLKNIKVKQSGRFYFWSTPEYPIPRQEIVTSSANVHLIPATDLVESILKGVREGQIVHLEGKLVKVKSADGWNAVSSLSRDDSGAGACEVFYVENAF